jgi:membrane associated rhomboid family serine protease
MMPLTDVVKNLLIINVIVYFGVMSLEESFHLRQYFVLYPFGNGFQPYQIVTSMFFHLDIRHLLFNMLALYFIGPMIEHTLGPKRFLFLYLSSGILSGIAVLLLSQNPALGASGAINGVVVALALMFPNMKMMVFPIPFEIKAIILVGLYLTYDIISGFGKFGTGVAHFGHLGGAALGAFLIFYWGLANLKGR